MGKPGRLTPAERAMVELHPVKGAEMLEPLEFLRPALPGAACGIITKDTTALAIPTV